MKTNVSTFSNTISKHTYNFHYGIDKVAIAITVPFNESKIGLSSSAFGERYKYLMMSDITDLTMEQLGDITMDDFTLIKIN